MGASQHYPVRHGDWEHDDAFGGLEAAERAGAPLKPRRSVRRWVMGLGLAIAAAGYGAEQTIWPGLRADAAAFVLTNATRAIDLLQPRLKPQAAAAKPEGDGGAAASSASVETRPEGRQSAMAAEAPPVVQGPPTVEPPTAAPKAEPQQIVSAALPPKTTSYEATAKADALPANDPTRAMAEAAGLHPDLSRAILTKLSKADFRNAETAIRMALAETPDDATFAWPRQRKPELALFEVYFVPGAAPSCRRYVVTIAKDGWLTTALPMEKCGSFKAAKS